MSQAPDPGVPNDPNSRTPRPNVLERLLEHDRRLVLLALGSLTLVSWLYILAGAGMGMSAFHMTSLPMAFGLGEAGMPEAMPGDVPGDVPGDASGDAPGNAPIDAGRAEGGPVMAAMATPIAWTAGYAVLMFFMWWVMMVAMMLPSAAPMILLHAKITRGKSPGGAPAGKHPGAPAGSHPGAQNGGLRMTAAFTLGYLLAWGGFSAVAALLQWRFEDLGVLSPMMMNSTSQVFAGSILIFAGLYQLTPLKQACLRHCRGPIQFLSQNWRPGARGALRMGLHHGAYCLGCCWGLMAVLFFGGIMNLYWIAGLALIVLAEKTLPPGPRFGKFMGAALIVWGGSFLITGV